MVFGRSCRLVPLESVTSMSWDARIFLMGLVRTGGRELEGMSSVRGLKRRVVVC